MTQDGRAGGWGLCGHCPEKPRPTLGSTHPGPVLQGLEHITVSQSLSFLTGKMGQSIRMKILGQEGTDETWTWGQPSPGCGVVRAPLPTCPSFQN